MSTLKEREERLKKLNEELDNKRNAMKSQLVSIPFIPLYLFRITSKLKSMIMKDYQTLKSEMTMIMSPMRKTLLDMTLRLQKRDI